MRLGNDGVIRVSQDDGGRETFSVGSHALSAGPPPVQETHLTWQTRVALCHVGHVKLRTVGRVASKETATTVTLDAMTSHCCWRCWVLFVVSSVQSLLEGEDKVVRNLQPVSLDPGLLHGVVLVFGEVVKVDIAEIVVAAAEFDGCVCR